MISAKRTIGYSPMRWAIARSISDRRSLPAMARSRRFRDRIRAGSLRWIFDISREVRRRRDCRADVAKVPRANIDVPLGRLRKEDRALSRSFVGRFCFFAEIPHSSLFLLVA